MQSRPIRAKAHEVLAILSGNQTQIRRVVNPKHLKFFNQSAADMIGQWDKRPLPYGKPGDQLWVREAFAHLYRDNIEPANRHPEDVAYKADALTPDPYVYGNWKPSIHMPRWASRITLEITDVRVERLQDISEADAIAEGTPGGHGAIPGYTYNATPSEHYKWPWESINGPGSWNVNPWVWVIEFKRIAP